MGRQSGQTLVELLIAVLLSLIVSGSAIAVMGNAMGTSSSILESTRLSGELRATLQMVSRDLRRAGYTSSAMWCLANTVCLPNVSVDIPVGASLPLIGSFDLPGGIVINDAGNCVTFELDRNQDGTVTPDEFGGFRRRVVDGAGVIELWTGSVAPNCAADSDQWSAATSADIVDVTAFAVDDDLSFDEVVAVDLLGNATTQRVRRIRIQIEGCLLRSPEASVALETVVDVRNDTLL